MTRAFSTLFVRKQTADVRGDYCFTTPDEAHAAALRQLAMHHAWQENGWIEFAHSLNQKSKIENQKLLVTLALEGAAPIRTVDDADVFYAAGVRMVSLAWAEGSRWSGGDQGGEAGVGDITADGRVLAARLDELGIIHDVSHLSERAFWTLLEIARGPVVASHSNCRSLLPGAKHPERHLSDEQLRALATRPDSRVGINLFARFILPPGQLACRRATIADLMGHMTHIEQLTGRRDLLALGSDFDSGFTGELLPVDLQGPQDLPRLVEGLANIGWPDQDITRFANNWDTLLPRPPQRQ